MKRPAAIAIAIGIVLSGCAPRPIYQASNWPPPQADPSRREECALIRREIVRQERIAQMSGVMATALVEAAVRLNASNVISGLETRAAIAGCG